MQISSRNIWGNAHAARNPRERHLHAFSILQAHVFHTQNSWATSVRRFFKVFDLWGKLKSSFVAIYRNTVKKLLTLLLLLSRCRSNASFWLLMHEPALGHGARFSLRN
jgi:hypothetical protein